MTACVLLCCGCGRNGTAIVIGEESREAVGAPGTQEAPEAAGRSEASDGAGEGAAGAESSDARAQEALIRVYVCGAVANPGVVEIPRGSRVEDALNAAGGFGADAGREAVNLADWVSDGQKLYFPREGEEAQESEAGSEAGSGLVNINTADVAALCTLPGIGESRARDIISYREANGGFESCEDIMKVSGIKTGAYEKIRDKITVQ